MENKPDKKPIFDDYHELKECNECKRYWDDQCDGLPQGTVSPCKSFSATRRVIIPKQIEALTEHLERLRKGCIATDIIIILHLLGHIIFK